MEIPAKGSLFQRRKKSGPTIWLGKPLRSGVLLDGRTENKKQQGGKKGPCAPSRGPAKPRGACPGGEVQLDVKFSDKRNNLFMPV